MTWRIPMVLLTFFYFNEVIILHIYWLNIYYTLAIDNRKTFGNYFPFPILFSSDYTPVFIEINNNKTWRLEFFYNFSFLSLLCLHWIWQDYLGHWIQNQNTVICYRLAWAWDNFFFQGSESKYFKPTCHTVCHYDSTRGCCSLGAAVTLFGYSFPYKNRKSHLLSLFRSVFLSLSVHGLVSLLLSCGPLSYELVS